MNTTKCDGCGKIAETSHEYDVMFPNSVHITETEKIQKLRVDYARKILSGDLRELTDKRTKSYDFCNINCLINFDLGKFKTAFDDWKEVIDEHKKNEL